MAGGVDQQEPGEGPVGRLDRRHHRFTAADARELLRCDPETHSVASDARTLFIESVVKILHRRLVEQPPQGGAVEAFAEGCGVGGAGPGPCRCR